MTGTVGIAAYDRGKLLNKGAFGAAHLVRAHSLPHNIPGGKRPPEDDST
jgi:hypothetical protein